MKKNSRLFSLLMIFIMFLGACNLPSNTPSEEGASLTAAAQTIQALLPTNTPLGQATPTRTFTPISGIPTLTSIPPSVPPLPSATSYCNGMQFITDVTIPDGTVMTPGQTFTKTWRLKNSGTCAWTASYAIVFSSGTSMNGPASQALTGSVSPGQTMDISVNLTAPASTGDYKGEWKLRDASGVLFGYFYVQIKVQNPPTATYTQTPPPAQVILNAVSGESGTVYDPAAGQGIPSTILVGDTSTNFLAKGYMSFDISTLSGKSIQSASLALSSCSQVQDPFGSLSGIWVGEVQYALPLDQSDYNIGSTGIQLLNSIPGGSIDIKSYVQTRVTEGKARFQIRLHPAAGASDGDGQADYMSCNAGSVTLTIVYQP